VSPNHSISRYAEQINRKTLDYEASSDVEERKVLKMKKSRIPNILREALLLFLWNERYKKREDCEGALQASSFI
jgi:hypothetical protein